MNEVGLMKTVPGESRMRTIENRAEPETMAVNSLAWKGTVLLVGMISLLVLLSGCYTVVATSSSGRLLDRYQGIDYEEWDVPDIEEVPSVSFMSEKAGGVEQQGMGVQIPDTGLDVEPEGVGVRYRRDYAYDPDGYTEYVYDEDLEAVVVGYRRPWIRRLYVDSYYQVHPGFHYRPRRLAWGWSVGWLWGGFSYNFGWYEPCWYDPFYWDWWWCDPFWRYDPCYSYYWYPWRWSYVHAGWYWPHHFYDPYYYWYDPFFYDPYWGHYGYYDGYWYAGRGTGVVVSRDYERRPADRRRGLADARGASDGNAGSRTRGTGVAGDRTGRADTPLTNSRRPTDRSRTLPDVPRSVARGTAGTRQGNSGSTLQGTKVRPVPPPKEGIVQGVKPVQTRVPETTAPSQAKNRNQSTQSGRSSTSRVIRTIGNLIGRIAGTSGRTTGSRTTSARRPTTSSRPTTTSSRPPPRTTSRPTTSRPPPRTTSRPTTSRPPPRTTSRPTTSRPPPRTTSRPTTSRPPPSADSGGQVSQRSPEVVRAPSGLSYHSYAPVPVSSNSSGMSSATRTRSFASSIRSFLGSADSSIRTMSTISSAIGSHSPSFSSGSRSMSSRAGTSGSRSRSSVSGSRTKRPPK